jgi:hypothetical protein
MAKRIYEENIKKWAIGVGITGGGTIIALLFSFLIFNGYINDDGHSKSSFCNATSFDNPADIPCEAYLNFTVNEEDLFIYPIGYDPWGRNTPFGFDPAVKDWKLYRSWGKGWRELDLTIPCYWTWCGAKSNRAWTNLYSVAFRELRAYQIKIVAIKHNPRDYINWSFGSVEPYWQGHVITELCDYRTEKIDIYDDVMHEYNYTHYDNYSNEEVEMTEYYTLRAGEEEKQICDRRIGYKIDNDILNFSACNIYCNIKKNGKGECDSCLDGNCDGKLDSGESGFEIDLKKQNWKKLDKKIDSKKFTKLEGCEIYG